MAYDRDLANRVRDLLGGEATLSEREMFGGIAFMISGNVAVGVAGDELIVRVGSEAAEDALDRPHARPFELTGRPMTGWVFVAPAGVRTKRQLALWVARGVGYARSLPAKG